jgi:hypothetical protein
VQIIKDGGYATDVKYVDKVCDIIRRYGLDKYDYVAAPDNNGLPGGVIYKLFEANGKIYNLPCVIIDNRSYVQLDALEAAGLITVGPEAVKNADIY